MMAWIEQLAAKAGQVLAVGSCAAYGGITAGGCNPAEACGLQYEGSRAGGLLGAEFVASKGLPVINIAGCPIHPNWLTETLVEMAWGEMSAASLDELGRPRSYADHLVHHGCPRNEYYEFKASAGLPSQLGCLMSTRGVSAPRLMVTVIPAYGTVSSCLRGGYACINCTAPGFEEPGHGFTETPKIAGIPIGLPTDMPKAWFVALASLSKAATPTRLKENAVADHIVVPPTNRTKDKP